MSTFGYGWVYRGIFQLIWVYMGAVMAVSCTENAILAPVGLHGPKIPKIENLPETEKSVGMSTDIIWGIQKGARKAKTKKKKQHVPTFFLDFMKSIFRISRISGFH